MFRLTQNRWFRRAALGTVAAIGLGAAMFPSHQAQASGVVIGFGAPGYVAPAPYYYGPYAYGYGYDPYYAYQAGGVYLGFGGGYHHHHWR